MNRTRAHAIVALAIETGASLPAFGRLLPGQLGEPDGRWGSDCRVCGDRAGVGGGVRDPTWVFVKAAPPAGLDREIEKAAEAEPRRRAVVVLTPERTSTAWQERGAWALTAVNDVVWC